MARAQACFIYADALAVSYPDVARHGKEWIDCFDAPSFAEWKEDRRVYHCGMVTIIWCHSPPGYNGTEAFRSISMWENRPGLPEVVARNFPGYDLIAFRRTFGPSRLPSAEDRADRVAVLISSEEGSVSLLSGINRSGGCDRNRRISYEPLAVSRNFGPSCAPAGARRKTAVVMTGSFTTANV